MPPHSEASKEASDGKKDGSENAVAETSKERSKTGNQTRNNGGNEANDKDENLGEDLEDRVEDGDELRSEASNSDDGLDSGENLRDEDDNEVEDSVDIRVGNIKTSSTGELGDNLSKLEVNRLKTRDGLGSTSVLAPTQTSNSKPSLTQTSGLLVDVANTALENSDELLRVGDSSTLRRRLGSLVDDLLHANLVDDVLSAVNSTVDLLNRAGVLLNPRNRGGEGRDGEGENREESGLHFECGEKEN
ncbi:hypothetical protein LB506_009280 [Fusarium annulatum]|nr:hypothetical protein LB506_009280 [Fusarium annulatum]